MNKITVNLPKLYSKQHNFVWDTHRYSLCLSTTKGGKTVSCICWLLTQALSLDSKNKDYCWLAPYFSQAKMAFRKMRIMLNDDSHFQFNETELRCDLPNGAHIFFKSSDNEQGLFGQEYWAVVIDEASRSSEESFHAIRSTITFTNAPVRLIANTTTRENWYYQLCQSVKTGTMKDYSYHEITADDAIEAGILKQEEIDDAKMILPHDVFMALYFCKPADGGGNPFGFDHIDSCVGELSKEPTIVYGCDIAKSIDHTVLIGMDKKGCVTSIQRWQNNWDITKNKIISSTGNIPVLVDSTGVGAPIVEDLKKRKHGVEGFVFSASSKQKLMELLIVGIQQHKITFPKGELTKELYSFIYEINKNNVRYVAPEGMHDDCVMALALCYRNLTSKSRKLGVYDGSIEDEPKDINNKEQAIDRVRLAQRDIWSR